MSKKVFIKTFGCQMNEYDSDKMADVLGAAQGYEPTQNVDEADLILFNTCSVREKAQEKVFSDLGRIRHLKEKGVLIGVGGCVASQEGAEIIKRAPFVDVVFGPQTLHRLPELLNQRAAKAKPQVDISFPEIEKFDHLPPARVEGASAFVSIMEGCSKYCSYCVVPYTRGEEVSRPFEDVLVEVAGLAEQGVKEITLLGQNVNAYGKDRASGYGFAQLLRDTAEIGVERVRFTTSHPWDFTDEMIEVIASYDNIMPAIHLPVQSGSSEMLKIMGRRYTREEYLTLFHKIKDRIPGCSFTTDIIVGFPNETEEQFEMTLSLVDECQYDGAFTFIYSPREGTPAARMQDNVPAEVKSRRLQQLNEKIAFYAHRNNEPYLGRIVTVLVDGPSKKNEQVYSGYSETNKLVNFTADHAEPGDLVQVRITEIHSWSLNGEKIEQPQPQAA